MLYACNYTYNHIYIHYICIYTMHVYILHSCTCSDLQAWLDIWGFLLHWNAAKIVPGSFFRENELQKEENNISEADSFPLKYPLHLLPTLFPPLHLWILLSSFNIQVQTRNLDGVTSNIKELEGSFKERKIGWGSVTEF